MAIGDDAVASGYSLVPGSGEDGKVKHGAREINRTRDYVANVKTEVRPVSYGGTGASDKNAAKANLGITYGTADPTGGVDGDIYFKIV